MVSKHCGLSNPLRLNSWVQCSGCKAVCVPRDGLLLPIPMRGSGKVTNWFRAKDVRHAFTLIGDFGPLITGT
jgi:hypothetical protein